ncbi:MAG: PQQ-binding-like beta-propeller repeat protein [Verrucomicrobiota bacterium]
MKTHWLPEKTHRSSCQLARSCAASLLVAALWLSVLTHVFAAEPPPLKEGLLLWLHADDGIQSKDGSVVGWQDYSGTSHHAERDAGFSTRAENPRLVPAAANGHAVLRFDGSDAAFNFARLTNIQTVFWVVAKDAKSFGQHNERFVLGDSTGKEFHVGTHKTAFILNPGEASPALRKGVVRVDGRVVNPLTTDFPDRLAVISMVATGYVSANQISKDRQFKDRSWQGDIAEIILYNRALPDAEREQVEKQLATKYSISAVPVPPAPVNAGKKSAAAQWPRWRGLHGDGISETSHIPIKWSNEEHVAWKADVEGAGNSSPCIWGDRIFLTSALGGKTSVTATHALCFDRASGKPLWRTEVPLPTGPLKAPSENNGWATPTAATDGDHIVVVFATGMVACLSPNGKVLWTYDLGPLDHLWGLASSPVIEGHRVFYSVDQGKRSKQSSFLVALDLATGRVEWREPISTSGERGYSTPLLFGENPRQLLLWAGNKLSAFDPATGAARWSQDVFALGEPITTPIQAGAKGIFIAQSDHAMALEVGTEGAKSLWSIDRSTGAQIARIANNLVYRDRLYAVSDAGQISCYDVTNGRRVWSAEIDDKFYAAPVAAAGHVIFTGRSGKFYVLNAGDEFQLAATNTLGWPCDASPAIVDGRFYFRTKQGAATTSLWCVADVEQ